jgi:hypothetical protein
MTLAQNKGSKTKHMTAKHRAGGKPEAPHAGATAVKFVGTVVHSDGGAGITSPEAKNAGSHDDKVRLHGGDD